MVKCKTDPECQYNDECEEFLKSLPPYAKEVGKPDMPLFTTYVRKLIIAVWDNHHPGAKCQED